jgi:hypothetical protein
MAPTIFGRFFSPGKRARVSGKPTSSNGASSFHLFWDVPPEPLRAVAVTLTVLEPPATPDLYFWALQASFLDADRRKGAAHLGLQHHPGYPGSTAANWGGYDSDGQELDGQLLLSSSLSNPNTCDFPWVAGVSYRLRIEPSPDNGWRGSITDLSTSSEIVLRDLNGGGSALGSPMVWSEVFADCGAPSTAVRWSEPTVETVSGYLIRVTSARVNYQSEAAGGCSNTTAAALDSGVLQRTSSDRVVPPNTFVSFYDDQDR